MAGIWKKGNQNTIFFASTVSEAEVFLAADAFWHKYPLMVEKCIYCSLYPNKDSNDM